VKIHRNYLPQAILSAVIGCVCIAVAAMDHLANGTYVWPAIMLIFAALFLVLTFRTIKAGPAAAPPRLRRILWLSFFPLATLIAAMGAIGQFIDHKFILGILYVPMVVLALMRSVQVFRLNSGAPSPGQPGPCTPPPPSPG
jgi:hypothetical protein